MTERDLRPPPIPIRKHAVMVLVLLVCSIAFYAPALNNEFWHDEDFRVLDTARDISADWSQLLQGGHTERHHPVPLALFVAEYRWFGLEPLGYTVVNLLLHGLNAFLVYWLVVALLPDRRIAVLSGLLFVTGVGSYGKAVMFMAGAENLLITFFYLLILNLYIRNDLWEQGKLLSWRYALVLVLFLLVSFAKPTAFSLVMGLLAYKVFFRGERGRGRGLLAPNLVILVVGAVAFYIVREVTGAVDFTHQLASENPVRFVVNFVRRAVMYLIHMFFPIHVSQLVTTSNPVVQAVYTVAPLIRFAIGMSIISYSVFGFIFGNRTIRFFLSWTFISVLPYCAIQSPQDWLNIRYLYQVAIGFTFLMASGTVLSMDLLHRRKYRKYVPFAVPLLFVILSTYITTLLDTKYERAGASTTAQEQLRDLQEG